jgi:hypothetical protein
MNEQDFLENYLWPSGNKLNKAFTHTLPNIEGLKKCGDFIVQCELEDTFSTNIMTTYESDTLGVRLIDISKNSQNKVTGVFIRLVGTLSLVKTGYPFLLLDAPISNVSLSMSEEVEVVKVEDIATKVLIFLPQADPAQRKIFFDYLSEQVKESGISYRESEVDFLPDFWGATWLAESKGANLDMIRKLRDYAWSSYKGLIEQTKEKTPFDYRPLQEHMIFDQAKREHLSFTKKGLSVPVEAQAAFFSVMGSDV